jgi:hypothetical protein
MNGVVEAYYWFEEEIEKYISHGSGWVFDKVVEVYLNINRYQPLKGGSYIKSPKWIYDKK